MAELKPASPAINPNSTFPTQHQPPSLSGRDIIQSPKLDNCTLVSPNKIWTRIRSKVFDQHYLLPHDPHPESLKVLTTSNGKLFCNRAQSEARCRRYCQMRTSRRSSVLYRSLRTKSKLSLSQGSTSHTRTDRNGRIQDYKVPLCSPTI